MFWKKKEEKPEDGANKQPNQPPAKKHEFDPNCAKCVQLVREGRMTPPPGYVLPEVAARQKAQQATTPPAPGDDKAKTDAAPGTAGTTTNGDKGSDKPGEKTDPVQPYKVWREPDGPLRPHRANPRGELLIESPRVLITPQAYKKMCLYIEIAPKEVGWLGTVSRRPNGDFLIEEVFLVEQEVTSVETELSVAGREKLVLQLLDKGTDEDIERANKLRFWGHSHVRMSTGPSGTDENTMTTFGNEGMPWYVRGIFTKLGRGEFTIYNYENGYRICDAPWAVYDPETGRIVLEPKRFGYFGGGYRRSWEQTQSEGYSIFGSARSASETASDEALPDILVVDDELRAQVQAEYDLKVSERIPVISWFRRKDRDEGETVNGGEVQDGEGIPTGADVRRPGQEPVRIIRKTDPPGGTIVKREPAKKEGGWSFWKWLEDLLTPQEEKASRNPAGPKPQDKPQVISRGNPPVISKPQDGADKPAPGADKGKGEVPTDTQ